MRRYFRTLVALSSAVVCLASCLSTDDDEVTLYSDTAVTSFSISTAKILTHTTTASGKDSSYYYTNSSMSEYPFSIDQANGLIFNADSLPLGTDATKLLCSYSSKNNGLVYIENINRDSIKTLSTTDSLDFSQPRYLRVFASDLSASRTYKVTVNVHQEKGDTFEWTLVNNVSRLAAFTGVNSLLAHGKMLVMGTDGETTTLFTTADGITWDATGATFGPEAYRNVAQRGDTIYVLDNNTLKVSTDGSAFADRCAADNIARLLGASTSALYALSSDGQLMASTDGLSWQQASLDDEASLLPTDDLSFCFGLSSNADSTDYVLLAGNRSLADYPSDANAFVWSKVDEYSKVSEETQWAYINFDNSNPYPLPRLSGLSLFAFGDATLAIGGAGIGACTYAPYSYIYESRDGGITWKRKTSMALPQTFSTEACAVAPVVDGSSNIWLFCAGTGQVWKGKLNSMAWNSK